MHARSSYSPDHHGCSLTRLSSPCRCGLAAVGGQVVRPPPSARGGQQAALARALVWLRAVGGSVAGDAGPQGRRGRAEERRPPFRSAPALRGDGGRAGADGCGGAGGRRRACRAALAHRRARRRSRGGVRRRSAAGRVPSPSAWRLLHGHLACGAQQPPSPSACGAQQPPSPLLAWGGDSKAPAQCSRADPL